MKIGAITIGQSPRLDVFNDIKDIFKNVEILEKGALDNLTKEEIEKFKPREGDYVLVSKLKDSTSVTFSKEFIMDLMQKKIYELEEEGAKLIMFYCTGDFKNKFSSKVPLIYPSEILDKLVPLLTKKSSIVCLTPSLLQTAQALDKWKHHVKKVKSLSYSPYEKDDINELVKNIKKTDADLIVLDCIGYSKELKRELYNKTNINVLLARTLLAKVVSELTL